MAAATGHPVELQKESEMGKVGEGALSSYRMDNLFDTILLSKIGIAAALCELRSQARGKANQYRGGRLHN